METTTTDVKPLASARPAPVLRVLLRWVLGIAMLGIGALHFAAPAPFVRIMPAWLPAPLALVYLSGAAEIAGGAGLFLKKWRRAAGLGLVALYIAVFPANLNMAIHRIGLGPDHPSLPGPLEGCPSFPHSRASNGELTSATSDNIAAMLARSLRAHHA